jgi:hypothetical protein
MMEKRSLRLNSLCKPEPGEQLKVAAAWLPGDEGTA